MKVMVYTSTVEDGNMSFIWGEKNEVEANRRRWLEKLGLSKKQCVFSSLDHGVEIAVVDKAAAGGVIEADTLMTKESQLGLFMLTADCFPVVVWDEKTGWLGLAHIGRPGVDLGLPGVIVKKFEEMGAKPSEIKVLIGPGIKKESYRWKGSLPFDRRWWRGYWQQLRPGEWQIDAEGFMERQFLDAGIDDSNLVRNKIDVAMDEKFFSHARSVLKGESEGRFATVAVAR